MQSLVYFFIFLSISALTTSKLLTREEYLDLQTNASFETLDYDHYLSIFKERNFEEIRVAGEAMHREEKSLLGLKNSNLDAFSFLGEPLPYEYDWRKVLPQCFSDAVRDQKNCGGCWAFATAGAFSERLCVHTRGAITSMYSAQDMLSCDLSNQGCNGGNRYNAWQFLQQRGIVSELCLPFLSEYGVTATCLAQCVYPSMSFIPTKARLGQIRILTTKDQIKYEVFTNGPVTAGIQTYIDLSSYKGGLYIPSTSVKGERHAIIIVGWGVQDGIEYFIVQNSWGTKWGENGFFKIPTDLCEISTIAITGDV